MLETRENFIELKENSEELLSKPMFSVHISNDISLFARKVMNSLIKNVHDSEKFSAPVFTDKYGTRYYEITFKTIEENLGLAQYHQKKDIIKALEDLMQTLITFNVFGRDKKFKGVSKPSFADVAKTTLLSNIRYREFFNQEEEKRDSESNKVYYSFTEMMLEAIILPIPYGRLSFDEQNKLSSKYSLALWEMLKTEIDVQKTDTCKTQIMTLQEYKTLIAGSGSEYSEFRRINENIIKKPLREVNEKTRVNAKVILHKDGRKTTGVQFEASLKEKERDEAGFDQSFGLGSEGVGPRIEVAGRLRQYIQNEKTLSEILKQYPDDGYILANLNCVVNNPKLSIALIRAALRDDYAGFKGGNLFSSANISTTTPHAQDEGPKVVAPNLGDDLEKMLEKLLIELGISEKKREEIAKKYSLAYVKANVNFANEYGLNKKIISKAPLYIKAIEENFANFGLEEPEASDFKIVLPQMVGCEPFFNDLKAKVKESLGEFAHQALCSFEIFSCSPEKLIFFTENEEIRLHFLNIFANRFEKTLQMVFKHHFNAKLRDFDIILPNHDLLKDFRVYS